MIDANMPQNTTIGGNETLFDINKILNKAYGLDFEDEIYSVYYFSKDTEGFKIQIVAFDKVTKEELSADDSRAPEGGPRQINAVSISTDFRPITIYIDSVETVIDTSNAVLCETINAYITEIGMIANVTDGSIIEDSNNSDKIILRNNEWDSKIN